MARIDVTRAERNEVEAARDNYLRTVEQITKAHGLNSEDVDLTLAYGEYLACEGYIETEIDPIKF